MGTNLEPFVRRINDNMQSLQDLQDKLGNHSTEKEKTILLEYPAIYIHNWQNSKEYEAYIGESSNVVQRTKQHYDKAGNPLNWQYQLMKHRASLYIIANIIRMMSSMIFSG